jgi:hypothetical protein
VRATYSPPFRQGTTRPWCVTERRYDADGDLVGVVHHRWHTREQADAFHAAQSAMHEGAVA